MHIILGGGFLELARLPMLLTHSGRQEKVETRRRVLRYATVILFALFCISLFLPAEDLPGKFSLWLFILSSICAMVWVGLKIGRPVVYRDPPGNRVPTLGNPEELLETARRLWHSEKDAVGAEQILDEMGLLKSVILNAFALSLAEADERDLLDRSDAQSSLKLGAAIFISYPLVNVLLTVCMVMVVFEIGDASLFWSIVIAYWVVIVGVNIWTSGVYHNNTDTIWKLGNEIREDPDRGPKWARRRSKVFILANFAYAVAMGWMML
jgi:hypothetical protein